MLSSIPTLLVLAALGITGEAQSSTKLSKDFKLQLSAAGADFNGQYLFACHTGAAQSALCISQANSSFPNAEPARAPAFQLNYTDTPDVGLLIKYVYPDDRAYPQLMGLIPRPNSNLGVAEIQFGSSSTVLHFDKDDLLFIKQDRHSGTPTHDTWGTPLYRWHMCDTYFLPGAYSYRSLSWVFNGAEPQNKTANCVPTNVKRIYVN
jgi:hypothetical protein